MVAPPRSVFDPGYKHVDARDKPPRSSNNSSNNSSSKAPRFRDPHRARCGTDHGHVTPVAGFAGTLFQIEGLVVRGPPSPFATASPPMEPGHSMTTAFVNRIATAVPPHDVHQAFVRFGQAQFAGDRRATLLFRRMTERSGIEHRYSCLPPAALPREEGGGDAFYRRGDFPDTAARMRMFEAHAPALAATAVNRLRLGGDCNRISHLIITSCTGFSAPGLDLELIDRCGLPPSVERTMVGFMGCYAAVNALKLARHIVRSERGARVLAVNLELCSLHCQETRDIEQMLSFLLFADGCAAALVTAEPEGAALDSFHAVVVPDTRALITWSIRQSGFDMVLSGAVPAAIHEALAAGAADVLGGAPPGDIDLWAVHPGGRTVLDAVERAFDLAPPALAASREVLRRYGNMSSATVMFVLEALLRHAQHGARGCAMSFGPGMVAETMLFHAVTSEATAARRMREPAEAV
jgi:predicted naringenin-chalcone synthase